MLERIISAPRWLLLAALVFAPWAYGCTRPWAVNVLNVLLGAVIVLWLAGCVIRRTSPKLHPIVLAVSGLLLMQAWWMVFNAKFDYDTAALQYLPLTPWL